MTKTYNFESGEIRRVDLEDYPESEYMIGRILFLGTRGNSHKLDISNEVFREYASSVLGAWVTSDMTGIVDSGTHTDEQKIVGIVPREQEVELVEGDDGYIDGYVDAVISKRYAKDFVRIFEDGTENRAVSVEMGVATEEGSDDKVTAFDIKTITVLGKSVKPSYSEADLHIVRFSEADAEEFYNQVHAKIEPDGKENEPQMNKEIEFAAVDIGDLWSKCWDAMQKRDHWDYCVSGIYEEDNQKFAIVRDRDGKMYRWNFSLTEEDGFVGEDEIVGVDFVETDTVKKFAEPENVADYRFACEESKCAKPIDYEAKCAELMADIESRDNIIMDKDAQIEQLSAENAELKEFKAAVELERKTASVNALLAEVKGCIDEVKLAEFKESGMACDDVSAWSNSVKAFAFEVSKSKKSKETGDGIMSFAAPTKAVGKKAKGLWD